MFEQVPAVRFETPLHEARWADRKSTNSSAMARNADNDILAASTSLGHAEAQLPIFNVERVQLNFNIASDFVAGQVANNVLILALATNRILRIDLENPADIDGTLKEPENVVPADEIQMSTYHNRLRKSA